VGSSLMHVPNCTIRIALDYGLKTRFDWIIKLEFGIGIQKARSSKALRDAKAPHLRSCNKEKYIASRLEILKMIKLSQEVDSFIKLMRRNKSTVLVLVRHFAPNVRSN